VGGGLVGSLEALYWSKRNYIVHVYEYRDDPRLQQKVSGYSINLALSVRGREALRAVGAEEHIVDQGIPMYARMIHSHDGTRSSQPYGKEGECILSIDRRGLNEHLITLVDQLPNVTYHFKHKYMEGDFDAGTCTFHMDGGSVVNAHGDLIVGCDGSYSAVRRSLMKKVCMDYSQSYIPHGYKEIEMLPNEADGEWVMEVNYLHIWPRNEFMMIGLPNQNKTFTLTLFMPFDKFDSIHTDQDIMEFFEAEFPDSIALIGKEKLLNDYKNNPTSPLICVKCKPYHYKDKVVIMGDAAHAMVPFYGQGMNCGFEDCLVLHDIMEKHEYNFGAALAEYTTFRNPDAEAIIDLAMYNYIEMRAHVNSRVYLLRKRIDGILNSLFPHWWIPLYSMTTFSRIRYHKVIESKGRQDKIITGVLCGSVFGVLVGVAVVMKRFNFAATLAGLVEKLK